MQKSRIFEETELFSIQWSTLAELSIWHPFWICILYLQVKFTAFYIKKKQLKGPRLMLNSVKFVKMCLNVRKDQTAYTV